MVDTGLIIEGIHVGIEIYQRIRKMGKLSKKLEGLDSHIDYIESILLNKKFEERLKSDDYPILIGILKELEGIVSEEFPALGDKLNPEHKNIKWHAEAFFRVKGYEKDCENLLHKMDATILRFSNALNIEEFSDIKEIKEAIEAIDKLKVTVPDAYHFAYVSVEGSGNCVTDFKIERTIEEQKAIMDGTHDKNRPVDYRDGGASVKGDGNRLVSMPSDRVVPQANTDAAAKIMGMMPMSENPQIFLNQSENKNKGKEEAIEQEGISCEETKEGFKVNIDYSTLELTKDEAKILQDILKGRQGTRAYAYKSSEQDEEGNIIWCSFKDQKTADNLMKALNAKIVELGKQRTPQREEPSAPQKCGLRNSK